MGQQQCCYRPNVGGFKTIDTDSVLDAPANKRASHVHFSDEVTGGCEKEDKRANGGLLSDFDKISGLIKSEAPKPNKEEQELVKLNIGGNTFQTTSKLLANSGSPVFAKLLTEEVDADKEYFLDRDGSHYWYIVHFIRVGRDKFTIPETASVRHELAREACFLGLTELAELLQTKVTPLQAKDKPVRPERVPSTQESSTESRSTKMISSLQVPFMPAVIDGANGTQYKGAPLPNNEAERLSRLESLNILHTSRKDARFDNITRLAAALFDVPIALVSLVHEDMQWFKSHFGLDVCGTKRSSSICAHMLYPEEPTEASILVIEDCTLDPRVMNNPLVTGDDHFRFYAGSPLVTSDGLRLGAFCVIDRKPRSVSPCLAQCLANLSCIVSQEIERDELMRLEAKHHDQLRGGVVPGVGDFAAGAFRQDRMRTAISEALLFVKVRSDSLDWPVLYASEGWSRCTSINVTSAGTLSSDVTASGPGLVDAAGTLTTSTNPMLWELLTLSPNDSKQLATMLKAAWLHDEPKMFHVNATMQQRCGTVVRATRVSCRFSPASAPLDMNAAVIKICQSSDLSVKSKYTPCAECYYFVTMHFEAHDYNNGKKEPESLTVTPSSDTTHNRGDDSVRKKVRIAESEKTSIVSVRSAVSPFSDVVLIRLVAERSFGKVFFALWSGAPVAVKAIFQRHQRQQHGVGKDNEAVAPIDEAVLSECMSHPNLVQTYKHSARPINSETKELAMLETWIVLEWCEGGTLADYCNKLPVHCEGVCRLPSFSEAVDICKDVASAGAYLHSRNIIHGDLSPKNILLKGNVSRKGFVCKVCDFGLASVCESDVEEPRNGKVGSLTHMPPESLSTQRQMTMASDVWSFAMVMLQVFTRQVPFQGLNCAQVVHQIRESRAPSFPENEHPDIKELYEQCIMKSPEHRPLFHDILEALGRAETTSDACSSASGNSVERRNRLLRKELS